MYSKDVFFSQPDIFTPLGSPLKDLLHARAIGTGRLYQYHKKEEIVRNGLEQLYPLQRSQALTYDQETLFTTRIGPFIEIGGPTLKGYEIVGYPKLTTIYGKKVHITNLPPEHPQFCTPFPENRVFDPDGFADANNIPYAEDSVGILFASCLPQDARVHFFDEAYRVLENGGVLVYQGRGDIDIAHALELTFTMLKYSRESGKYPGSSNTWSAVFTK